MSANPTMRPIWQTSEFWSAIIGNGVALFVAFQGLSAEQGTEMTSALQTIAGGVLSVATILGFIQGQGKRKIAAASLMIASLQTAGGDPQSTLANATSADAKRLLSQF